MYWQFGYGGYLYGCNYNDGFIIYLEDFEVKELVYGYVKVMNKFNKKKGGRQRGSSIFNILILVSILYVCIIEGCQGKLKV